MRIAYVVDVHGRYDAVLQSFERIGPVDVLVIGGDITTLGTPDDAQRAIELWRPLAPRILAVAGNMDSPEIDDRLVELGVSLNGRGVMVGEVGFFGASAAPHSPCARRTRSPISSSHAAPTVGSSTSRTHASSSSALTRLPMERHATDFVRAST